MTSKCNFCGEKEAIKTIPNPNDSTEKEWKVCEGCAEVIPRMKGMAFEMFLADRLKRRGLPHKSEEEIREKYGFKKDEKED